MDKVLIRSFDLGSGKTCTMFGTQSQIGILGRSVEFVLQSSKTINVSAVEVVKAELFDLTIGEKIKITQAKNAQKKSISSLLDFNHLVSKVLEMRLQKSTDQNSTSSRSHLIFYLSIANHSNSDMAFIDLAGWESPNDKENHDETKFINSSLSGLNTVLGQTAKKQHASFDTMLAKLFKPYLTGTSKTCMLYHVSSTSIKKGLENIKNVVPSNLEGTKRKANNPLQNITNSKTSKPFL